MNQDTKKKFDNILNKARNLSKLGVRGLFLPRQITSSLFRENTSIDIANLNMNEVATIVDECEICALHKNRNSTVFGEGNTNANLMFIGEAPGKDEDIAGKPFVGKAGQLLDKIIVPNKHIKKQKLEKIIEQCYKYFNKLYRYKQKLLAELNNQVFLYMGNYEMMKKKINFLNYSTRDEIFEYFKDYFKRMEYKKKISDLV